LVGLPVTRKVEIGALGAAAGTGLGRRMRNWNDPPSGTGAGRSRHQGFCVPRVESQVRQDATKMSGSLPGGVLRARHNGPQKITGRLRTTPSATRRRVSVRDRVEAPACGSRKHEEKRQDNSHCLVRQTATWLFLWKDSWRRLAWVGWRVNSGERRSTLVPRIITPRRIKFAVNRRR